VSAELFQVSAVEWEVLCGVIDAMGPEGPVNVPYLSFPGRGTDPRWYFTSPDGMEVSVAHDRDISLRGVPDLRCVVVPPTLIRHGHLLAHTEEGCDLLVDTEGYLHLAGHGGSDVVIDQPAPDVWWRSDQAPFVPELGPLAEAVVDAGALCRAMVAVSVWPPGTDEDVEAPVVQVEVDGDQLAFGINWRPHGLYRLTNRIPAHAQGSASIGYRHEVVERLVTLATRPDEVVTVRIYDSCVVFEAERWTAIAEQVETGAARLMVDAADLLRRSAFVVRWLSRSAITVNADPAVAVNAGLPYELEGVRIEAFIPGDGDRGVVRVSTVLVDDVGDSPELRSRMDDLAAAGAGLSTWLDEGRLVVACDLESGRLAELPSLVDRFRRRVEGLDVLFADAAGVIQLELLPSGDGVSPEVEGA